VTGGSGGVTGEGDRKIKALNKPMENLNIDGMAVANPTRKEDGWASEKPVLVDINANVYKLDKDLIPAGVYYNVRAIRAERGTDD
jgi:hypothetical protein